MKLYTSETVTTDVNRTKNNVYDTTKTATGINSQIAPSACTQLSGNNLSGVPKGRPATRSRVYNSEK